MTLTSQRSKVKRYSGIVIISLIVGLVAFLTFASVSGIPDEYVFGNFRLSNLGYSNVYMIAKLEPQIPMTIGEEIQITVYRSDDMQPLADRTIGVKNAKGEYVDSGWTNSTGQGFVRYPGEGSIIRITSDGSYIRDAIIFLPVEQKWVTATALLYVGSIVTGVAVGIGLHFLFKRKH